MFNWLFGDHSVDGILGEFHSLIARLELAVNFHNTQKTYHDNGANKHDDLATQAMVEAERAQSVADKLKVLVG